MECAGCGAANPDGNRFCGQCGQPLPRRCPSCGAATRADNRFCGQCGAELAAGEATPDSPPATAPGPEVRAGERRPVTVLFCDLAGYTRMTSEADAESVHDLLNRYFAAVDGVIESFGGTIDKHIGDAVMALFGAPVAHSDDPERAVRAALAIHEAIAALDREGQEPLHVHVGIASGRVVASHTGSDAHGEYTVIGDSVNLAARLQDLAGPDETLISEEVHAAVSETVDAEALGAVEVKGLEGPVAAWRVRAWRGAGPVEARLPLVGRRAEVRQMAGLLDGCVELGRGQVVHLRGEPGIGKTRLVAEAARLAEQRGFAVHRSQVLDFGVGRGRDAARELVRSLLGEPDVHDTASDRRAARRAADGGAVADQQTPFLHDLLDLPQNPDELAIYQSMDNAARLEGKRRVLEQLVRSAAARQAQLIAIEDVHWADPVTLSYVAAIAATVADCAALLVISSRIEGDPLDQAWRGEAGQVATLTLDLGPLRPAEARAFADAMAGLQDEFVRACVERAGGNPLFLGELLRSAGDRGADDLPDSIQSLVLARVDALPGPDRRALQAAAAIGQRFSLDLVRILVDDPSCDLALPVARQLVRPDAGEFQFAHALIRDGIYAALLTPLRRDLHRRAAEWFRDHDPVLCAQHLDRADDPEAPAAHLDAAEAEASAYRYGRALRLAERGLELAKKRADRFALTELRGELLRELGRASASVEAYRLALDQATGPAERCRSWIGLAAGMRITDRYDEALDALDEARRAAEEADLALELARVHHLRGNLYFPLGRIDECRAEHEAALVQARRADSFEIETQALGGLGDAAYAAGRMKTAHRNFTHGIELARRHGLGRIEVANLPMAANSRRFLNELEAAADDCEAAVEAAVRVADRRAELVAHRVAYDILLDLGAFDRCRAHLERAEELAEALGAQRFQAFNLLFRAKLLLADGAREEAERLLRAALADPAHGGVRYVAPILYATLACAAVDETSRRAALQEGWHRIADTEISHNHIWLHRDGAEACLMAGDWDGADRHAAALAAYTADEPLPWTEFFIARARALAAWGRGRRDAATRRELRRLRQEGEHAGFRLALRRLEAALDAA